mgnify:CR=1 FL=1
MDGRQTNRKWREQTITSIRQEKRRTCRTARTSHHLMTPTCLEALISFFWRGSARLAKLQVSPSKHTAFATAAIRKEHSVARAIVLITNQNTNFSSSIQALTTRVLTRVMRQM